MPKRKGILCALVLVVLGLGFHLLGGMPGAIGAPVALGATVLLLAVSLAKRRRPPAATQPAEPPVVSQQAHTMEKEVDEETGRTGVSVLGTQYRRQQWKAVELVVDGILETFLRLMRRKFDAHTIAVLFPAEDGGYTLRKYDSKSDCINASAVIYPGKGVLGSFLKDGLKQLNLHDIVSDSITLHYYTRDAGIRSLIASPITADDGVERGTVIVDSTEPKHFSEDDHDYLATVAHLIGLSVYYAYMGNAHKLSHQRIAAMSATEKDFFQNLEIDAVLNRMLEIIPFAIDCDRITLSLRNADGTTATVRRAWGEKAEAFSGLTFSLEGKSLVSLLYAKNMAFSRNFADERSETLYADGEPDAGGMRSFLAFPVGVGGCRAAVLLESAKKNAYPDPNDELLARIATSAGLAIEKLQLLEQAQNLATHDGLTGLINHREFQAALKKEITRAIRYGEPLSLAIGDIDFFKKINDTYGHPFGDVVLKEVSAKLSANIRQGVDIAARYGGEEFALILVQTDGPAAQETMERIRQILADSVYKGPHGEDLRVTMSFGIAVYGVHAKQLDLLISKADKALYRAKEAGRNRVEMLST
jgi:diguanylate cyclase (GGDEF)-like protein